MMLSHKITRGDVGTSLQGDVKPHALFTAKLAEVLDAAADIASPAVGVKISFGFPCRLVHLLGFGCGLVR